MPTYAGVPEAEVSLTEIGEEQRKAAYYNSENAELRRKAENAQHEEVLMSASIEEIDIRIARLLKEMDALNQSRHCKLGVLKTLKENTVAALAARREDIDLAPFNTKISEAEATNRMVRNNKQRAGIVTAYKNLTVGIEELTSQLAKMDADKHRATVDAKYPVPGLCASALGVTFNGIPFSQCSAAEQLKVSVAIGLALNPKLRVLLIRDGSLLDEDSMKILCEMAAKADAQVWIERVGSDAQTSVVIEDGHVA